jgi:hypothetical protein
VKMGGYFREVKCNFPFDLYSHAINFLIHSFTLFCIIFELYFISFNRHKTLKLNIGYHR